MRHVICALSILCGLSPAMQAGDLTVVLDFESSMNFASMWT